MAAAACNGIQHGIRSARSSKPISRPTINTLGGLPGAGEQGLRWPLVSFAPKCAGLYDLHTATSRKGVPICILSTTTPNLPKEIDPPGPSAGTGRVVRGGDWRFPASFARSANRDFTRASRRDLGNGFRVACDRKPTPGE